MRWPDNIFLFVVTVMGALMLLFCIAFPIAVLLLVAGCVIKPAIWFYDKCRAEAKRIYG